MNNQPLTKSYSSKLYKTDQSLNKTLLSQKSSVLNKTLKNKMCGSTLSGLKTSQKINHSNSKNILDKNNQKKKEVNEKIFMVTTDMYTALQKRYNELSYSINTQKEENNQLKKSLNNDIINLQKENENLKKSQNEDLEQKNKNIAEFNNINEYLKEEIEKTKKLIIDKQKEIDDLKLSFHQFKEVKKENFEKLLALGRSFEDTTFSEKNSIIEYKPRKYVDLLYTYKKIKTKVSDDALESFFSPLEPKIQIINDLKYYHIDDLNDFLEKNNIFQDREIIRMKNFSDIINVEFFLNAIRMINND